MLLEDVGRAGRGGESSGEEHGGGVRGDQSASGCFARVDRELGTTRSRRRLRGIGRWRRRFGCSRRSWTSRRRRLRGWRGLRGRRIRWSISSSRRREDLGPGGAGSGDLSPDLEALFRICRGWCGRREEGFAGVDECGVGVRAAVRGCARVPARAQPDPVRVQLPPGHRSPASSPTAMPTSPGTFGGKRYQTQVGLIDPDRCSRATRRNSDRSRAATPTCSPTLLTRTVVRLAPTRASMPGRQGAEGPDRRQRSCPPCFVAPPSLLHRQAVHPPRQGQGALPQAADRPLEGNALGEPEQPLIVRESPPDRQ